jgi:hypothetical protein
MPTIDTEYDNRNTCGETLPSSCIPYTGYVSDTIKNLLPCRPNINDVVKNLQILIDDVKAKLGDNTTLDETCLDFDPATATQKAINQELITELCTIKTQVENLIDGTIDPDLINVAISLLCLEDPACEVAETYTLTDILNKLVTNYCSLLDRVVNIESILNI